MKEYRREIGLDAYNEPQNIWLDRKWSTCPKCFISVYDENGVLETCLQLGNIQLLFTQLQQIFVPPASLWCRPGSGS